MFLMSGKEMRFQIPPETCRRPDRATNRAASSKTVGPATEKARVPNVLRRNIQFESETAGLTDMAATRDLGDVLTSNTLLYSQSVCLTCIGLFVLNCIFKVQHSLIVLKKSRPTSATRVNAVFSRWP